MNIYNNISELIGSTPIVRVSRFASFHNIEATILVKLESLNPAGSVKDRIAKAMVEQAEKEGLLTKGSTIIEPTSGNTGIGLALMAASRGYSIILTMPETMSVERQNLLRAYGAEVVLTPGSEGMRGSINKAQQLAQSIENSFIPSQFTNFKNPQEHYKTTGKEIWEQTGGKVDLFVSGIGTGGTISGAGQYLKEKNSKIKVIGVEPTGSALLSTGKTGSHGIQGIGAGFIPDTLNQEIYDEIIAIENEEAYEEARTILRTEGIFVGISSGAALSAAVKVARSKEYAHSTIVVMLPDSGDRYLSTPLFHS
jgi:cysteine synthase A